MMVQLSYFSNKLFGGWFRPRALIFDIETVVYIPDFHFPSFWVETLLLEVI